MCLDLYEVINISVNSGCVWVYISCNADYWDVKAMRSSAGVRLLRVTVGGASEGCCVKWGGRGGDVISDWCCVQAGLISHACLAVDMVWRIFAANARDPCGLEWIPSLLKRCCTLPKQIKIIN